MLSRRFSAVFFVFVGLVLALLAFYEKRISLVQSQVKSQLQEIQQLGKSVYSQADWRPEFEALEQRNQELKERLQVIMLNFTPDEGPGEELVRDIIKQGLLLRYDLLVLWQQHISQLVRHNRHEQALKTLSSLKALPPKVKEEWLYVLSEYPTWQDIDVRLAEHHQQIQREDGVAPSYLRHLGISISRKNEGLKQRTTPGHLNAQIRDYIQKANFDEACQLYTVTSQKEELTAHELLDQLCDPQRYFVFNRLSEQ